jgi:hypothetical protein
VKELLLNLVVSLRQKLSKKTDVWKNCEESNMILGAEKDTQGSSSYYAIRKTAAKSKVEELLATPSHPIARRKY